ncbi:endonuclease [Fontisphaera persica]|uniref:endonuclease I family protein n=1 Tax=Fontisphaera persica TaxID=2974023 RepID=UPI0024C05F79|nr:endonuclease [Fontisphaera persica]WCJ59238.1 endonuclease [Fontisphaera persica]
MRPWWSVAPCLFWLAWHVSAQPAPDYYAPALGKAGRPLREALHQIVRGHTALPYTSSTRTDTRAALAVLWQHPQDTNLLWLTYAQRYQPIATFGTATGWNREHRWPNSLGLFSAEPAYSDLHHLHPDDATVNGLRSNKYYDESDPNEPDYRQPAHFEAPQCSSDTNSWAAPPAVRGDIARSLFYMAIRYTGDTLGEPALRLTDETNHIVTGASYMGRLRTLLAWHHADPPDDAERRRNNLIDQLYQHNRNPFVDHPEWVNLAFAPPPGHAPRLEIHRELDHWRLRWMATNQFCLLETAPTPTGAWTTVESSPVLTHAHFELPWPSSPAVRAQFFRLRVVD